MMVRIHSANRADQPITTDQIKTMVKEIDTALPMFNACTQINIPVRITFPVTANPNGSVPHINP